jgi:hypothetical protein
MGTRRYLHRCGKASGVVVVAFTTWEICARGPVLGASGGNRQQRELERELVLERERERELVLERVLVLERERRGHDTDATRHRHRRARLLVNPL